MRFILAIALLSFLLEACNLSQAKVCPQKSLVEQNLSKLITREFSVELVKPSENMKNLCEVVIKVGLRPIVLYTDGEGKNYILGNMINVDTKENLTQKLTEQFATVSDKILKELEKRVNMVYGKGEKYVYYITDPDCPFCRRFSPMLKEWADKNNVTVKVILLPLPIHPEAKPKAIAMVCDGLGYDKIHANVDTKNQCEKGKKAIEDNLQFLTSIGINGTPTVIGMNGKYIVGLPRSPEELNKLVN